GPNLGSNAVILIEVNIAIGFLAVGGGNSTVRGLAVNGYGGIFLFNLGGNTVAGNFLGINAAGTAAPAHAHTGVQDIQVNSSNNTIGGTTPAARNVISGVATPPASSNNGITVTADNNVIQGNLIGTNAAGNAAIGNNVGIFIMSGNNNQIGGTTAA